MAEIEKTEEEKLDEINAAWETESGLIDDVDAIIRNARFGTKDEYAQAVVLSSEGAATGLMFLVDLVNDEGEELSQQGWSVGSGWTVSEDGKSISHPKRENVVNSSLYGQLQTVVIKELQVPMGSYGNPLKAESWDGLKFHWMLKGHATVGGEEKQGLMPTEFFGKVEAAEGAAPAEAPKTAAGKATKAAPAESEARKQALMLVGAADDNDEFVKLVVKNAKIAGDDGLMAEIMDDSENGFFAKNKG